MNATPIAKNVDQFIARASETYGRMARDRFYMEMTDRFEGGFTDSPIEQIFFAAVFAVAESQYDNLDKEPAMNPDNGECFLLPGLYVQSQKTIGKFRVDFAFEYITIKNRKSPYDPVIVELDGHAFHDKNKQQRSYEKARDRYLTKQGYRVIHFTGSDIVADPFKAAWEVLEMFGGYSMDDYDPKHPLGDWS